MDTLCPPRAWRSGHSTLPLSARLGALNGYPLTRAGVRYDLRVGFLRADRSLTTIRDTATTALAASVAAEGAEFTTVNGITGTDGHHIESTPDSASTVASPPACGLESRAEAPDSGPGESD